MLEKRSWLLVVILATCWIPAAAAEEDSLIGLWGSRTELPPTFRGQVVLTQGAKELQTLCVAGQCEEWKWSDDQERSHRFELPGVGAIVTERDGGSTHWIQPRAATYNGWATPIRMKAYGPRSGGVASPFVERRTFYLRFLRGEKGELRVFLRNPERNIGIFANLSHATVDGDAVTLINRDGEEVTEARLVNDGASLLVPIYGYGTIELRRLDDAAPAIGFYPRPGGATSTLQPPLPDEDWEVASPKQAGLKVAPLTELVEKLSSSEVNSVFETAMHAVLVARNGKLVVEEYFAGHDIDTLHDTRSAGKTIASMLAGAMRVDPDTTVCDSLPWAKKQCAEDSRRAKVTLEHLISMSAGFDCDDGNEESPGNEDRMQNQSEQPDWYRYILDLEMIREPGEAGVYCSGGMNLAGAILSAEGDAEVFQLFDRYLAQPLNIQRYHMNLDPLDRGYLGGGLNIRPRDMLKFGEMMRTGGVWNGKRILSEKWVEESFAAHASLNEPDDYGYAWWRQTLDVGGRPIQSYYASGNGGQLLFVVPELEMTVLFMGGNYMNYWTWRHFRDDFLPNYILNSAF